MKLRVVVAEDDPDFLRVLASILRAEFEVVGTAEDASSAVCLARTHQPDVAVVDLEISGHSGFEVTKSIAATRSRTAVVVCSLEKDPEFVAAAHHAGPGLRLQIADRDGSNSSGAIRWARPSFHIVRLNSC